MSIQSETETDRAHTLADRMAALGLPPTCYARFVHLLRQYEAQAKALDETRQALQREIATVGHELEQAQSNVRPRQW